MSHASEVCTQVVSCATDRRTDAVTTLQRTEGELAQALLVPWALFRHEHEFLHISRDLARWSQLHVRELGRLGRERGLTLPHEPLPEREILRLVLARARRTPMQDAGVSTQATTAYVSLAKAHAFALDAVKGWDHLLRAAHDAGDHEVVRVALTCGQRTRRRLEWTKAAVAELDHLKHRQPR